MIEIDQRSLIPKVEACKKLRRSISNRTELRRAVAAATLDARVRWGSSWDFGTPSIANSKPQPTWKSIRQWLEAMQLIAAA